MLHLDPPAPPRKRLAAALVLASLALALASAQTWRERQVLRRAARELAACERTCALDAVPEDTTSGLDPEHDELVDPAPILDPARAHQALLTTPLEVLCSPTDLRRTRLRDALTAGAPNLVHIWTAPCAACDAELPLLAAMFDALDDGLRQRVAFLPVDGVDSSAPAEDYRRARELDMPAAPLALVDRSINGPQLLRALARILALQGQAGPELYPTSFVLDCKSQLRWVRRGALDREETEELAALLAQLDEDGACRLTPRPPLLCKRGRHPPPPPRPGGELPPAPPADPTAASTPSVPELPPPEPPATPEPAPEPPRPPRDPAAPPAATHHPDMEHCLGSCNKPRVCFTDDTGVLCSTPPSPV